MNYITIDIDLYKYQTILITIDDIIENILKCKEIIECYKRVSCSMNGYHIKIFCKKDNCDLCRMVFDDQTRFTADKNNRKKHQGDKLFCEKIIIKNGKEYVFKASEWEKII